MDTFTKEEAKELKRAAQDINLFLRLAHVRLNEKPDDLPFKRQHGHLVINWLIALSNRYGKGIDITNGYVS